MASAYTVALVGFAQNESSTFESFFRLAARRPPAYSVQDEVMDAQVLIVNADNAQALHLVRYAALSGKVLLVGQNDGGTGWPLQRKPIKLVSMLGLLDELVGARRPAPNPNNPAQAPAVSVRQGADRGFAATESYTGRQKPLAPVMRPAVSRGGAESEFPNTRPMVRRMAAAQDPMPMPAPPPTGPVAQLESTRAMRPGVMGVTDFGELEALPIPAVRATPSWLAPPSRLGRSSNDENNKPVPPVRRGDVLLVAESLVEGRILHKRFKKYDLAIDWSREAKQALEMIKAHAYRLVVIDRLNGAPDAYSICRAAKQRKLANGTHSVVMMFAPTAGSMDRLKAGLAGSDAYLSRSVAEAELYKVLAQHRLVNLDGFEKTNVGGF
jgi:CheY-like chemotaxis protein